MTGENGKQNEMSFNTDLSYSKYYTDQELVAFGPPDFDDDDDQPVNRCCMIL